MSDQKKILILCTHNYQKQPRVLRTIEALKNDYHISVAGNSDAKEHSVNFIQLAENTEKEKTQYWHFNKPAVVRLPISFYYKYIRQKQFYKPFYFEQQYWTNARKADLENLRGIQFDLVISHGVDTLPLAVKMSNKKILVIFNAHEYYPLEFEQDKKWLETQGAQSDYLVRKYLPKCDLMFCVSEQIQNEYKKNSKINSVVITNATGYNELEPTQTSRPVKILHHGAAMKARQIELMAEMMNYLGEDFELYLMLVPTEPAYLEKLKSKYKTHSCIKFITPVSVSNISKECNNYDIGLFILPPVNFNWLNALPNKLFEFIQGRLCLAVSPNPDMKKIVENYNLGIVSEEYSPRSMAEKIKKLSVEDINNYKNNSHKHALELSAENNRKKILQTVNDLLLN